MSSRFVLTLICTMIVCGQLTLNAQKQDNTIAYYIADTIMAHMPLHKEHQDSLAKLSKSEASQQEWIKYMKERTICGDPIDTAKDSPLLKQLRKTQWEQLDSNSQMIKREFEKQYHITDSTFRAEEIAEIQKNADIVAKQKGYEKIYEKSEAIVVQKSKPTGWSPEDVTELVMKEMKLK